MLLPVRPPGGEKISRLGSRNPGDRGVKCGPHGGKNGKMKSWTVSWLSLKTKVDPGLRGSRVMSGDWRRLHRVHGVSCGLLISKTRMKFRSASVQLSYALLHLWEIPRFLATQEARGLLGFNLTLIELIEDL
jgi:hypothetical protein